MKFFRAMRNRTHPAYYKGNRNEKQEEDIYLLCFAIKKGTI